MFNPNEEFVVVSIYRKSIAEMFNEIIEQNMYDVEPFSGNDARLTYNVCREVTDVFIDCQACDSEEDRSAEERIGVKGVFDSHFFSG